MFIDRVKIKVKGGDGGDGLVSMRREKFVPLGGPDGGNGGSGGSIIFEADSNKSTLLDLRFNKQLIAKDGQHGKPKKMHGRNGEDLIVKVPIGTVVRDLESDVIVADLIEDKQQVIIAKGGSGGKGNYAYMSNRHKAPDFAQKGEQVIFKEVEIELKLLADVGLVGFPSVGKSTFLSVVSKAKPEIADYPFTTLKPNLGIATTNDQRSFTIADLPGLIEGASLGKGLGHQFLRHIERTRVLIHIVDMGDDNDRDPIEDYKIINEELGSYQYDLLKRPQVVVANKMDGVLSKDKLKDFKNAYPDLEVFETTTIFNQGLEQVLYKVADLLEEVDFFPIIDGVKRGVVYKYTSEKDKFEIKNLGNGVFEVGGDFVISQFRRIDVENERSLYYFLANLRDKGLDEKLRSAGAINGDIIIIDNYEFDFVD